MRHDTEKQIAATIKAFKPIEAYLQQKKKLAEAFTALDAKVAKTEEDHKAFMQKAGAREAQRLLGEANDADALKRKYEYFDPLHSLPEAGQQWWEAQPKKP